MGRELFGTDGVRGLAGQYPLDKAGAYRIGLAVGTHFAQPSQKVVIGQDTRESSPELVRSLVSGLNAAGVNVVSVGVLPTPGLAYITREHPEFVAGVMVTASHNPYQYNGVKVFDSSGGKLPDATEDVINQLIEDGAPEVGNGSFTENPELVKEYEDFLVGSAAGLQLSGLKVAVDSANGAASGLAGRVFERLNANVTRLFENPDGRNINEGCGATNVQTLQKTVLEQNLDLGIALDGDADRLIMVDNQGKEVKGDYLLYILAVSSHADGVVATIMSNQGFELELGRRGIKLVRAKVGDRYVLEELTKSGYRLGGEEAGHIIIMDLLATGDGLLAAVQTLKAINESGRSLAEWCNEVKLIPQALINLPVEDKSLLEQPAAQAFIEKQNNRLNKGRLLVRPSGTEPVVRVMVESEDADEQAEKIAAELKELLDSLSERNPK